MNAIPLLHILGAGKLGKTLGRLFHQADLVEVGKVKNSSYESSKLACTFIGAGSPTEEFESKNLGNDRKQIWLISCPDSSIEVMADSLSNSIMKGDIVFHCSGALSSDVLRSQLNEGVHCASVHPVHSFAAPEKSIQSFSGTYCAIEGDGEAVDYLKPLIEGIGGETFTLDAENKLLYHTATVMACNYLTSLFDSSLAVMKQAGVHNDMAVNLLAPLARNTLENVINTSPAEALTGPISRGDYNTVSHQLEALSAHQDLYDIYRSLGVRALTLAEQQGLNEPDRNTLLSILSK